MEHSNYKYRSCGGFSLVEIMIVSAIMGIIGLMFSQMVVEQSKATAYLEDQLYKFQINQDLEILSINSLACSQSLGSLNVGGVGEARSIVSMKNNLGAVVIASNSDYEKIHVGQMTVFNESVATPDSAGYVILTAPLERRPTRMGQGSTVLKPAKIRLYVRVDTDNKITNCLSSAAINPSSVVVRSATGGGSTTRVDVYCNPGEVRLSCSGTRQANLTDTCNEQDCGYIGTIPLDTGAVQGCATSIDEDGNNSVSVYAFCYRM